MKRRIQPVAVGGAIGLGLAIAGVAGQSVAQMQPPLIQPDAATIQSPYPICQPPNPGEYLLLVTSQTPDSQQRVRQVLPPSASSTVCNYLDTVVTRVSGFTTIDTANAWARYLSESIGLTAFVARPAEVPPEPVLPPTAPTATATPTTSQPTAAATAPATAPARNPKDSLAFKPQPLGAGYAVLVDYFSQPELAVQIQQLLKRDVGLVSYGQRPFLLAVYTGDPTTANAILQTLTDRGYWAMVVDSRRVTLLRQTIDVSRLK